MSSTIKTKSLDHNLKRQQLQESAKQKSQATSSHLTALNRIKEAVQQSKAELKALSNSRATINHIKIKNEDDTDNDSINTSPDQNRLYNRNGRLDSVEENLGPRQFESTPEEAEPEIANLRLQKNESEQSEVVSLSNDNNFYKAQDRGNQISEDAFGYYIDAYAPENEKDGVRVSITHDKAIISGSRKAQNEFQDHDKKISTNNFQTFREEFAFANPVVSDGMTRERDGDYVRFFIPKMNASKAET